MKVFNKFEIGDIVVSLTNINSGTARVKGEMVEVEDDSTHNRLCYKKNKQSTKSEEFRASTPIEQYFYAQGGRNINDMIQTNFNDYEIY